MRQPDELRSIVERWYEMWNKGDKDGWLALWRDAAPGDPHIEDPVGTPIKRGWDMASELWDRTGGSNHFPCDIQRIIVAGNEVAAIYRCEGDYEGTHYCIDSVDIFRFAGDTLILRTYFEMPMDLPYMQWSMSVGEPVG